MPVSRSSLIMKMLWISVVLAVVVRSAVAGVYSLPVRTVLPHAQSYSYSSQYFNTVPLSYNFGLRPQLAYQFPHYSGLNSFAPSYYPIASVFPGSNQIYYPTAPQVVPVYPPQGFPAPAAPAPSEPTAPEYQPQPAGDEDTAIVDAPQSTEQNQQPTDQFQSQEPSQAPQEPESPQQPQTPEQPQTQPQTPAQSQPANTFPSFEFPPFPDLAAQFPQQPQNPSSPGQIPSFPSLNPSFPSFNPTFPGSNPAYPQAPSSPPSSFPGSDNSDRGLNDEDTISVESA